MVDGWGKDELPLAPGHALQHGPCGCAGGHPPRGGGVHDAVLAAVSGEGVEREAGADVAGTDHQHGHSLGGQLAAEGVKVSLQGVLRSRICEVTDQRNENLSNSAKLQEDL